MNNDLKLAVIIPCYKIGKSIKTVIEPLLNKGLNIYVIDDACPFETGKYVDKNYKDNIKVITHDNNSGVGAAMITGYKAALQDNIDIMIKIDGDGQMNPDYINDLIAPIRAGFADYTKGNRFYNLEYLLSMPKIRILGNAILSFANKLSSGYWNIFDVNNGYTAITSSILKNIPLNKIHKGYFFESDMLFRLNLCRAVVVDVPMPAIYGDEISGLKIHKIIPIFIKYHIKNFIKRIIYNYFIRDMSIASFELLIGLVFIFNGISVGLYNWIENYNLGLSTPNGTIMLVAIQLILGVQFLLAFISADISSVPRNRIF